MPPHQCPHCPQICKSKFSLTAHIRTHTGERPFQCQICDKTFATNATLKGHMFTHSLDKPWKCKECGKAYSRVGGLVVHSRKHTRDARAQAENEASRTAEAVASIAGSGEGEGDGRVGGEEGSQTETQRNFGCDQCDRAFHNKGALQRHIRQTHEECFPVDAAWPARKQQQQQQEQQQQQLCRPGPEPSSDDPLACELCGRIFANEALLDAHRRTHLCPDAGLALALGSELVLCDKCGRAFSRKEQLVWHERLAHGGRTPRPGPLPARKKVHLPVLPVLPVLPAKEDSPAGPGSRSRGRPMMMKVRKYVAIAPKPSCDGDGTSSAQAPHVSRLKIVGKPIPGSPSARNAYEQIIADLPAIPPEVVGQTTVPAVAGVYRVMPAPAPAPAAEPTKFVTRAVPQPPPPKVVCQTLADVHQPLSVVRKDVLQLPCPPLAFFATPPEARPPSVDVTQAEAEVIAPPAEASRSAAEVAPEATVEASRLLVEEDDDPAPDDDHCSSDEDGPSPLARIRAGERQPLDVREPDPLPDENAGLSRTSPTRTSVCSEERGRGRGSPANSWKSLHEGGDGPSSSEASEASEASERLRPKPLQDDQSGREPTEPCPKENQPSAETSPCGGQGQGQPHPRRSQGVPDTNTRQPLAEVRHRQPLAEVRQYVEQQQPVRSRRVCETAPESESEDEDEEDPLSVCVSRVSGPKLEVEVEVDGEGSYNVAASDVATSGSSHNFVVDRIQLLDDSVTEAVGAADKDDDDDDVCEVGIEYQCSRHPCRLAFPTMEELETHISRAHPERSIFQCHHCKGPLSAFDTAEQLDAHARARHQVQQLFVCGLCKRDFYFLGHLRRHLHTLHGIGHPDAEFGKNMFVKCFPTAPTAAAAAAAKKAVTITKGRKRKQTLPIDRLASKLHQAKKTKKLPATKHAEVTAVPSDQNGYAFDPGQEQGRVSVQVQLQAQPQHAVDDQTFFTCVPTEHGPGRGWEGERGDAQVPQAGLGEGGGALGLHGLQPGEVVLECSPSQLQALTSGEMCIMWPF